ncbi:MAG: hypothetical protein V4463_03780 [Pseudomonadota bacterium]
MPMLEKLKEGLADRCTCVITVLVVAAATVWVVNTLMFAGSFT